MHGFLIFDQTRDIDLSNSTFCHKEGRKQSPEGRNYISAAVYIEGENVRLENDPLPQIFGVKVVSQYGAILVTLKQLKQS
jgi:hypothetical protein